MTNYSKSQRRQILVCFIVLMVASVLVLGVGVIASWGDLRVTGWCLALLGGIQVVTVLRLGDILFLGEMTDP